MIVSANLRWVRLSHCTRPPSFELGLPVFDSSEPCFDSGDARLYSVDAHTEPGFHAYYILAQPCEQADHQGGESEEATEFNRHSGRIVVEPRPPRAASSPAA